MRSTLEKTEEMPPYVAAGVALLGVDADFLGVDFALVPFPAGFFDLTGLDCFAGPFVTRPDLVFPRTFFSSTIAGAWSHVVSKGSDTQSSDDGRTTTGDFLVRLTPVFAVLAAGFALLLVVVVAFLGPGFAFVTVAFLVVALVVLGFVEVLLLVVVGFCTRWR